MGDVSGRIAIIAVSTHHRQRFIMHCPSPLIVSESSIFVLQDNLIDEVDSIIAAADFLKDRGAYKVYAVATHGILSKDSPEQLERSAIEEVCDGVQT